MWHKDSKTCVLDGKQCKFIVLKAFDYNLMMMKTCSCVFYEEDARINVRIDNDATFEFKCSEIISNHCKCRGAVYDNNNKRHDSGNGWAWV